jgi:hypothetical protein
LFLQLCLPSGESRIVIAPTRFSQASITCELVCGAACAMALTADPNSATIATSSVVIDNFPKMDGFESERASIIVFPPYKAVFPNSKR